MCFKMNSHRSAVDSVGLKSSVVPNEAKNTQPWSWGQLGNKPICQFRMYKAMRVFLPFHFPLLSGYLISFPSSETLSVSETFENAMTSLICEMYGT